MLLISFLTVSADRAVLFERAAPPAGWRIAQRASPDAVFGRLVIPLSHPAGAAETIRAKAEKLADPTDAAYGEFMAKNEILDLLHPGAETAAAVEQWLRGCGVHWEDRTMVDAWRLANTTTVRTVECLFATQVMQFRNDANGGDRLATSGAVSLPANLRAHVPFVPSLSDFPLPDPRGARRRTMDADQVDDVGAVDKGVVAPKTLASLYSVDASLYPASGATLAIAELDVGAGPSSYSPTYLFGGKGDPGFFELAGVSAHEASAHDVKTVGPFKTDDGELEANLDMQYGASTARGASLVYWTEERWMFELATGVFNGEGGVGGAEVDVLSISYAWSEAHQCLTPAGKPNPTCSEHKILTPEYVARVNTEFAKLGAAGTTVVVSSGDDGAPGNFGACDGKLLDPLFPAASPYVLTVGGTMLAKGGEEGAAQPSWPGGAAEDPICKENKGCATSIDEVGCSYPSSGITSGGGFSTYSPRPAFQDASVSAYLRRASALPARRLFNASNRGYPDVAALANNYAVYAGALAAGVEADAPEYHFWIPTDGTSAAAPVVAGLLALARAKLGKRLGLVAPSLYHLAATEPGVFRDVTSGSNACKSSCCGKQGYKAAPQWDAVTGLGTLNAKKLIAALGRLHGVADK